MPSAARVSLLPGPCGRRRDAKAEDVADMPEMQEVRAAWRPLPMRREAREPCRDGARQGARQGQGQERRAVAQGLRRGRVPGQPRARHRLARGHVRSLRQARGRAPSVGQVANAAGLRSPPREAAAKRRRKPRGQPGPPVRQVPRARRRRAAPKGCPPLARGIEKNTAHRSRPRAAFLVPMPFAEDGRGMENHETPPADPGRRPTEGISAEKSKSGVTVARAAQVTLGRTCSNRERGAR